MKTAFTLDTANKASRIQQYLASHPDDFFSRIKYLAFFCFIRGQDLPVRLQQKPSWKQFNSLDWAMITYFVASNAIKIACCGIATEAWLRSPDDVSRTLFKTIYIWMANVITPVMVLANGVAVWRKREVSASWWKSASECNSGQLLFTRGQNLRFKAVMATLMMFLCYEIYYLTRTTYTSPIIASIILEETYCEFTYMVDSTPLILYHFAQVFQNLESELSSIAESKGNPSGSLQKVEGMRVLFRKWIYTKRLVKRYSGAASFFWLPFLLWAVTSISMKIVGLLGEAYLKPGRFWYDVISINVRGGIVILIFTVGQAVTDSGALLLERMAELDPIEDPDLWKEAQMLLATTDAQDGVHVTFGNFFGVNRSIIPSILMVVVTYFIALVQIKDA